MEEKTVFLRQFRAARVLVESIIEGDVRDEMREREREGVNPY